MKTRQPKGTQTILCVTHHGHYYEVRFCPDQRLEAGCVVEWWWHDRRVSREQYLALRDAIIDRTWEPT